jgi:hypothetical protein
MLVAKELSLASLLRRDDPTPLELVGGRRSKPTWPGALPTSSSPIRGACQKQVRWAAPETTRGFVANSRNVPFQDMVKSITISKRGEAGSTVSLE